VSRTDAVTRILFEAFSAAEVRLFYVFGYMAIGIFSYGVYVQIRKYRRGAALNLPGSLWDRLGDMIAKVFSHRTIRPRGGGRLGASPDILRLPAAVSRHRDHHFAVRHSRAAVRHSFLVR
jgi:hypothetical protein